MKLKYTCIALICIGLGLISCRENNSEETFTNSSENINKINLKSSKVVYDSIKKDSINNYENNSNGTNGTNNPNNPPIKGF